MSNQPYSGVSGKEMILRDHLAVERTDLANERTLLAYVRTALALFAAGASLIHFFDSLSATAAGWVFVLAGGAALLLGVLRYRRMAKRISAARQV